MGITEFLQRHQAGITMCAALDVIGDAEASKQNWLYMRGKGVESLPTYHQSEPIEYLHYYARQLDYIAVGGLVGTRGDKLDRFLGGVFYELREYWPIRVHAFGVTNMRLLAKYPFYSADSTSWASMGRFATSRVHRTKLATVKAKTRHYLENGVAEVDWMLAKEQELTRAWQRKGITWND